MERLKIQSVAQLKAIKQQSRIETKKNRNTLKQKRNLSVITGDSGDSQPKISIIFALKCIPRAKRNIVVA